MRLPLLVRYRILPTWSRWSCNPSSETLIHHPELQCDEHLLHGIYITVYILPLRILRLSPSRCIVCVPPGFCHHSADTGQARPTASKRNQTQTTKTSFWAITSSIVRIKKDLDQMKMTCLLFRVFSCGTLVLYLHYMEAPAPDPSLGTWAIRDETSPRGEGVWGDRGILVHSCPRVADQEKTAKQRSQRSRPTLTLSSWR